MKTFGQRLERILHVIVDVQQVIASTLLVVIMVLVTFDVAGRNIWNHPIQGSYELTELGSALLVFLALAVTHRAGDHISIDFVATKLPIRMQQWLYAFVELVSMVVLFVIARELFKNGVRMMERGVTTTDLSIPTYPVLYVMTFATVIFALVALMKSIHHVMKAVKAYES